MATESRPATAADAAFLAWVMQEAARSHLERGVWDLMLPGPEVPRLEFLAKLATTEQRHFAHFSRFRVIEVDGQLASGLSAYENAEFGLEKLLLGVVETLEALGRSPDELATVAARGASFYATGYPEIDGIWIIEWVATHPEFRGRGLIRRLLLAILEKGRQRRFAKAQIGYLLGNVRAKSAYEGVGFEWLDEHCHPDFERDYGEPGLARMQLDL